MPMIRIKVFRRKVSVVFTINSDGRCINQREIQESVEENDTGITIDSYYPSSLSQTIDEGESKIIASFILRRSHGYAISIHKYAIIVLTFLP